MPDGARAVAEGWRGEIEGIDLIHRYLADKQEQADRSSRTIDPVRRGMPSIRKPIAGSTPDQCRTTPPTDHLTEASVIMIPPNRQWQCGP